VQVEYWKSLVSGAFKPRVPVLHYVPECRQLPPRVLPVVSAWKGIESVLGDLITKFGLGNQRCLEFGVEFGYSTAALSCFFDSVTGVDTFVGDIHTADHRDVYQETVDRLSAFPNIRLVRSDYRDWIAQDNSVYDLIHVDIVHTYAETFACGLWSARHSNCVLFHDTESFATVKRAVIDICRASGKKFYNFKECNGLGILV
jgi:Methyltransferase domain